MAINWLDGKTFITGNTLPKKIRAEDIALGTGLLNYELCITQELFIQYLIDYNFIKKSEEKPYKNAFKIQTKGDALKSTLGPLFNKIKDSGVAYPKDIDVINSLLNTRNEYIHEFVHKTIVNDNLDYHAAALTIIKSINAARKMNNRYMDVHAKFIKDSKKQSTKKKQPVKVKKYTDEQMDVFIREALLEVPKDEDNRFYWADLGNTLKKKGIEPNMYTGSLQSLYKRLYK